MDGQWRHTRLFHGPAKIEKLTLPPVVQKKKEFFFVPSHPDSNQSHSVFTLIIIKSGFNYFTIKLGASRGVWLRNGGHVRENKINY